MAKTLVIVALFLFALDSRHVFGQTSARQVDPLSRATQGENALAPSDGSSTSPTSENVPEARRLYKEAVKYGNAGLFRQAAELFERVLKQKPDYADAYFGLGHAYFDLKQWNKAIESLQHAVELNPRDKEAQDLLDQARSQLKQEPRNSVDPVQAKSETEQVKGAPVSLIANPPAPGNVPKTISANELILTKIYRVGPGDVLDVRFDEASSKSTLFTVTPSGLLEHPSLAEPLPVAGLTVDEISGRIESELKRRALTDNPKVAIGVRDYVSHTILVSGLVNEAGTKILRREAIPLFVVVADAQPLPEAARVSLVRNETNEIYDIDLLQPAEMNLLVHPGDVITLLPNNTQFFYIGGEVKSPGEKTFRRGLTLTQAVIAAGGLTRKSGQARLARDNGKGFLVVSRYKLKDIESGKVADPSVQPGDRITIVE